MIKEAVQLVARRHRLTQRRIALGFTQEQLAERMDVDPSTVRRWESGASENGPKPWLRPKLARHLQVSIDQLDDLLADADEPGVDTGVDLTFSLQHVESLRRGLHDVLAEGALSDASLDDWELTVVRHAVATRDRPAALLLADLSADFAELQEVMSRCRSLSTLRRLTRVAAHMSGLMCLTLVKLDERTAFRGWAPDGAYRRP